MALKKNLKKIKESLQTDIQTDRWQTTVIRQAKLSLAFSSVQHTKIEHNISNYNINITKCWNNLKYVKIKSCIWLNLRAMINTVHCFFFSVKRWLLSLLWLPLEDLQLPLQHTKMFYFLHLLRYFVLVWSLKKKHSTFDEESGHGRTYCVGNEWIRCWKILKW